MAAGIVITNDGQNRTLWKGDVYDYEPSRNKPLGSEKRLDKSGFNETERNIIDQVTIGREETLALMYKTGNLYLFTHEPTGGMDAESEKTIGVRMRKISLQELGVSGPILEKTSVSGDNSVKHFNRVARDLKRNILIQMGVVVLVVIAAFYFLSQFSGGETEIADLKESLGQLDASVKNGTQQSIIKAEKLENKLTKLSGTVTSINKSFNSDSSQKGQQESKSKESATIELLDSIQNQITGLNNLYNIKNETNIKQQLNGINTAISDINAKLGVIKLILPGGHKIRTFPNRGGYWIRVKLPINSAKDSETYKKAYTDGRNSVVTGTKHIYIFPEQLTIDETTGNARWKQKPISHFTKRNQTSVGEDGRDAYKYILKDLDDGIWARLPD